MNVSWLLRKYHLDPGHVIQWQEVVVVEDATDEKCPIQILDRMEQVLRIKTISFGMGSLAAPQCREGDLGAGVCDPRAISGVARLR